MLMVRMPYVCVPLRVTFLRTCLRPKLHVTLRNMLALNGEELTVPCHFLWPEEPPFAACSRIKSVHRHVSYPEAASSIRNMKKPSTISMVTLKYSRHEDSPKHAASSGVTHGSCVY